jgi:hypothetical protein
VFCYHDGTLLNNDGRRGPVAVQWQAFTHPFVFPSGRPCRTFDELVLACQEEWTEARTLLEQGYLESFFAGLGRTDLARAARAAASAADRDRGLDELLDKLPSDVLQPPSLQVQPQEINLGTIRVGEERRFTLQLENLGMRLLRGSASCAETPWLTLGDAAGVPEKLFQFNGELVLPVHVQGKRLRASQKPQEGYLAIESNGGTAVVTVRVEVPVTPFPDGVLRGALTPRQVAEKAKAAAKEAAAHFENGNVARWYVDNGWTYPVQGPAASGLGAVQQFFEALGLTPPPKVEVGVRTINLVGSAGERLQYALEVKCQEKRPVYAYGVSDQPWLKVGRANLQGRLALIPLVVPGVPDRPGETLQAEVLLTANGNQRFPVSVALSIIERSSRNRAERARPAKDPKGIPVSTPWQPPPVPLPVAQPASPNEENRPARPRRRSIHLLPVWLLLLALFGVFVADIFHKSDSADDRPRIAVLFHDKEEEVMLAKGGSIKPDDDVQDAFPAVWEPSMRFGVVMLDAPDPRDPNKRKRLTFEEKGRSNNTVVHLDGQELLFGERPFRLLSPMPGIRQADWPGRWHKGEHSVFLPGDGKSHGEGRRSVWVYERERVVVMQIVTVVAGEQSRLLDTCLVRYVLDNQDTRPHVLGLRFLLDTYIGANDGVPFTIPGASTLCDTQKRFDRPEEVPDFIQALERENLSDPGTVAHLQLRLGERLEPPTRVTLGSWPNPRLAGQDSRCRQEKTLWEVPVFSIKILPPGDSAVTLYWDDRTLAPGARREVGFAYGLGSVASAEKEGRLGLSMGGRFVPGGEFTLTALVREPLPGETLTLTLQPGLAMKEGTLVQAVPAVPPDAARRTSPVTWRIRADREGRFTLRVQSSTGTSQAQSVRIRSRSIFD